MRMRHLLLLTVTMLTACSAEHVMVATLDSNSAGGSTGGQDTASGASAGSEATTARGGSGGSSGGTSARTGATSSGGTTATGGSTTAAGSTTIDAASESGGTTTAGGSGESGAAGAGGSVASVDSGADPGVATSIGGISTGISIGRGGAGAGGSNDDLASAGAPDFGEAMICSCLGDSAQACGVDGVTYDSDCGESGTCLRPEIACWHACPCADDKTSDPATLWFIPECDGGCRDGASCFVYSRALMPVPTGCATTSN